MKRPCRTCHLPSELLPRQRVCSQCQRSKDRIRYNRRKALRLHASLEHEIRESFIACFYCGHFPELVSCWGWARPPRLELDHVIPLHLGGTSDPSNLVMACRACNRSKGAKQVAEWIRAVHDGICRTGSAPIPVADRWA